MSLSRIVLSTGVYIGETTGEIPSGAGVLFTQGRTIVAHFSEGEARFPRFVLEENGDTYMLGANVATISFAASGNRYEGDIDPISLQSNGFGVFTWSNKKSYSGEFTGNKIEGRGMIQDNRGTTIVSDFVDGKATGFGCLFQKDRSYQGALRDGKRHGYGSNFEGRTETAGKWSSDELLSLGDGGGELSLSVSSASKVMAAVSDEVMPKVRNALKQAESAREQISGFFIRLRRLQESQVATGTRNVDEIALLTALLEQRNPMLRLPQISPAATVVPASPEVQRKRVNLSISPRVDREPLTGELSSTETLLSERLIQRGFSRGVMQKEICIDLVEKPRIGRLEYEEEDNVLNQEAGAGRGEYGASGRSLQVNSSGVLKAGSGTDPTVYGGRDSGLGNGSLALKSQDRAFSDVDLSLNSLSFASSRDRIHLNEESAIMVKPRYSGSDARSHIIEGNHFKESTYNEIPSSGGPGSAPDWDHVLRRELKQDPSTLPDGHSITPSRRRHSSTGMPAVHLVNELTSADVNSLDSFGSTSIRNTGILSINPTPSQSKPAFTSLNSQTSSPSSFSRSAYGLGMLYASFESEDPSGGTNEVNLRKTFSSGDLLGHETKGSQVRSTKPTAHDNSNIDDHVFKHSSSYTARGTTFGPVTFVEGKSLHSMEQAEYVADKVEDNADDDDFEPIGIHGDSDYQGSSYPQLERRLSNRLQSPRNGPSERLGSNDAIKYSSNIQQPSFQMLERANDDMVLLNRQLEGSESSHASVSEQKARELSGAVKHVFSNGSLMLAKNAEKDHLLVRRSAQSQKGSPQHEVESRQQIGAYESIFGLNPKQADQPPNDSAGYGNMVADSSFGELHQDVSDQGSNHLLQYSRPLRQNADALEEQHVTGEPGSQSATIIRTSQASSATLSSRSSGPDGDVFVSLHSDGTRKQDLHFQEGAGWVSINGASGKGHSSANFKDAPQSHAYSDLDYVADKSQGEGSLHVMRYNSMSVAVADSQLLNPMASRFVDGETTTLELEGSRVITHPSRTLPNRHLNETSQKVTDLSAAPASTNSEALYLNLDMRQKPEASSPVEPLVTTHDRRLTYGPSNSESSSFNGSYSQLMKSTPGADPETKLNMHRNYDGAFHDGIDDESKDVPLKKGLEGDHYEKWTRLRSQAENLDNVSAKLDHLNNWGRSYEETDHGPSFVELRRSVDRDARITLVRATEPMQRDDAEIEPSFVELQNMDDERNPVSVDLLGVEHGQKFSRNIEDEGGYARLSKIETARRETNMSQYREHELSEAEFRRLIRNKGRINLVTHARVTPAMNRKSELIDEASELATRRAIMPRAAAKAGEVSGTFSPLKVSSQDYRTHATSEDGPNFVPLTTVNTSNLGSSNRRFDEESLNHMVNSELDHSFVETVENQSSFEPAVSALSRSGLTMTDTLEGDLRLIRSHHEDSLNLSLKRQEGLGQKHGANDISASNIARSQQNYTGSDSAHNYPLSVVQQSALSTGGNTLESADAGVETDVEFVSLRKEGVSPSVRQMTSRTIIENAKSDDDNEALYNVENRFIALAQDHPLQGQLRTVRASDGFSRVEISGSLNFNSQATPSAHDNVVHIRGDIDAPQSNLPSRDLQLGGTGSSRQFFELRKSPIDQDYFTVQSRSSQNDMEFATPGYSQLQRSTPGDSNRELFLDKKSLANPLEQRSSTLANEELQHDPFVRVSRSPVKGESFSRNLDSVGPAGAVSNERDLDVPRRGAQFSEAEVIRESDVNEEAFVALQKRTPAISRRGFRDASNITSSDDNDVVLHHPRPPNLNDSWRSDNLYEDIEQTGESGGYVELNRHSNRREDRRNPAQTSDVKNHEFAEIRRNRLDLPGEYSEQDGGDANGEFIKLHKSDIRLEDENWAEVKRHDGSYGEVLSYDTFQSGPTRSNYGRNGLDFENAADFDFENAADFVTLQKSSSGYGRSDSVFGRKMKANEHDLDGPDFEASGDFIKLKASSSSHGMSQSPSGKKEKTNEHDLDEIDSGSFGDFIKLQKSSLDNGQSESLFGRKGKTDKQTLGVELTSSELDEKMARSVGLRNVQNDDDTTNPEEFTRLRRELLRVSAWEQGGAEVYGGVAPGRFNRLRQSPRSDDQQGENNDVFRYSTSTRAQQPSLELRKDNIFSDMVKSSDSDEDYFSNRYRTLDANERGHEVNFTKLKRLHGTRSQEYAKEDDQMWDEPMSPSRKGRSFSTDHYDDEEYQNTEFIKLNRRAPMSDTEGHEGHSLFSQKSRSHMSYDEDPDAEDQADTAMTMLRMGAPDFPEVQLASEGQSDNDLKKLKERVLLSRDLSKIDDDDDHPANDLTLNKRRFKSSNREHTRENLDEIKLKKNSHVSDDWDYGNDDDQAIDELKLQKRRLKSSVQEFPRENLGEIKVRKNFPVYDHRDDGSSVENITSEKSFGMNSLSQSLSQEKVTGDEEQTRGAPGSFAELWKRTAPHTRDEDGAGHGLDDNNDIVKLHRGARQFESGQGDLTSDAYANLTRISRPREHERDNERTGEDDFSERVTRLVRRSRYGQEHNEENISGQVSDLAGKTDLYADRNDHHDYPSDQNPDASDSSIGFKRISRDQNQSNEDQGNVVDKSRGTFTPLKMIHKSGRQEDVEIGSGVIPVGYTKLTKLPTGYTSDRSNDEVYMEDLRNSASEWTRSRRNRDHVGEEAYENVGPGGFTKLKKAAGNQKNESLQDNNSVSPGDFDGVRRRAIWSDDEENEGTGRYTRLTKDRKTGIHEDPKRETDEHVQEEGKYSELQRGLPGGHHKRKDASNSESPEHFTELLSPGGKGSEGHPQSPAGKLYYGELTKHIPQRRTEPGAVDDNTAEKFTKDTVPTSVLRRRNEREELEDVPKRFNAVNAVEGSIPYSNIELHRLAGGAREAGGHNSHHIVDQSLGDESCSHLFMDSKLTDQRRQFVLDPQSNRSVPIELTLESKESDKRVRDGSSFSTGDSRTARLNYQSEPHSNDGDGLEHGHKSPATFRDLHYNRNVDAGAKDRSRFVEGVQESGRQHVSRTIDAGSGGFASSQQVSSTSSDGASFTELHTLPSHDGFEQGNRTDFDELDKASVGEKRGRHSSIDISLISSSHTFGSQAAYNATGKIEGAGNSLRTFGNLRKHDVPSRIKDEGDVGRDPGVSRELWMRNDGLLTENSSVDPTRRVLDARFGVQELHKAESGGEQNVKSKVTEESSISLASGGSARKEKPTSVAPKYQNPITTSDLTFTSEPRTEVDQRLSWSPLRGEVTRALPTASLRQVQGDEDAQSSADDTEEKSDSDSCFDEDEADLSLCTSEALFPAKARFDDIRMGAFNRRRKGFPKNRAGFRKPPPPPPIQPPSDEPPEEPRAV